MTKITILGANSYIARNVIRVLRKNYSEYLLKLYDYAEKQIDGEKNYTSINILNPDTLKKVDFDCDVIFMFIGKTGSVDGFDGFNTFIDINEKALLNLISGYRTAHSSAKIIFPSTRLVYKGNDITLKEDAEKEFKTIYAMNKYACEKYLEQYHKVFGLQYCIFRICVPYGTLIRGASSYGTAEFMVSKAVKGKNISIYGDGSVRRSLIYMEDLCNVLIKGGLSSQCCNDVYNIGGENYSLKEMAELVALKYNVGIDYVAYPEVAQKIESGSTVFDDNKLNQIIPMNYNGRFWNWINDKI